MFKVRTLQSCPRSSRSSEVQPDLTSGVLSVNRGEFDFEFAKVVISSQLRSWVFQQAWDSEGRDWSVQVG